MTHIADDVFAAANDGRDLVPGNQRAITAISSALANGAAELAETRSTLDRLTSSTTWSGHASEVFRAHATSVIDAIDQWHAAAQSVVAVLDRHQAGLCTAQDTADDALELWRKAQTHAAAAPLWHAAELDVASNADQVRQQLDAAITRASDRAHRLLSQARTTVADSGQAAADVVRAATQALQAAQLPAIVPPHTADRHKTASGARNNPDDDKVITVEPHDTLYGIAQHDLGDASRWPEIYQLNVGHAVAPHHVLVNPNHIEPGWSLRLPTDTSDQVPAGGPAPAPPAVLPPGPFAIAPVAPAIPPGSASIPAPPAPAAVRPADHAFDLGDGLILAGGAAVVVAGVAAAVGIRRRYTAGRVIDTAGETEPVVQDLTLGLTAVTGDASSDTSTTTWGTSMPIGYRNGRTVLVDTAATIGLGLVGPGASAAARALLISVLATDADASVRVTSTVRDQLLGARPARLAAKPVKRALPGGRIRVYRDLDELLSSVEPELVTRTRLLQESAGQAGCARLVLVVEAPVDGRRLAAVASNGAGLGIVVVTTGVWPAGITCHVGIDGRIARVSGDAAERWPLAGASAFTAGQADAHTLLGLLGHVEPELPGPRTARPLVPDPRRIMVKAEPAGMDIVGRLTSSKDVDDRRHDPAVAGRIGKVLTPEPAMAQPPSPTIASEPAKSGSTGDSVAAVPLAPIRTETPLILNILGEVVLEWTSRAQRRDIIAKFMPKFQEVLVYLALHPHGVRRARLSATIWPNSSQGGRPFNSFHSALSQIRRLIASATNGEVDQFIERDGDRYQLNTAAVGTDYVQFQQFVAAHRGPSVQPSDLPQLGEAVNLYRGDLASNLKASWLEAHREGLRRDFLARLVALVDALRKTDPAEALDLLHQAIRIDQYNEEKYRTIMHLQAELGLYEAIPRTLALLSSKLADIDERPSAETTRLTAIFQQSRIN